MLQYLIVLLDDTSTSYCHYSVPERERKLIALDDLKKGILFAMKENLTIQFVYPNYALPEEYSAVIESIDHIKIRPANSSPVNSSDVVVLEGIDNCTDYHYDAKTVYVLRVSKNDLFENGTKITSILGKVKRLNVVITNIESFTDNDFITYRHILDGIGKDIVKIYFDEGSPQFNLLTDRMLLNKMNNCNAGCSHITLAPDGRLYICPAFYYENASSEYMGLGGPKESPFCIGQLTSGIEIKNAQLYKIEYAPLCRNCDAYQCKRCIWLNWKTTLEVNTPSRQQCVVSHLERNASRELMQNVRKYGEFLPEQDIPEIKYLDPFDVKQN